MPAAFSEVVGAPAWRAEAEAWIRGQVVGAGATVTGAITQPRIRPWSTQLVVPTDAGTMWFKANCPAMAFEASLHAALARLDPGEVDPPVAVERERGWLLTRDRGETLGDAHEPTLADWQAVVATAAGMQRRLAAYRPELVDTGLPDCSPPTVPARFEAMVDRLAGLPPGHPSALPSADAARLRAGQEVVARAAAALSEGPMPATLQHGDLHPGNVFAVDGRLRVFDFGDAQLAHPLEILAVPYGWLTRRSTLPWAKVLAAYASVWDDVLTQPAMEELLPAAMVTQAVNRSWTWWEATVQATRRELAEWGGSARYYLELALEPFAAAAQPSAGIRRPGHPSGERSAEDVGGSSGEDTVDVRRASG